MIVAGSVSQLLAYKQKAISDGIIEITAPFNDYFSGTVWERVD
jgi:hypothetical protein